MKKVLSLILAMLMLLGAMTALAACGDNGGEQGGNGDNNGDNGNNGGTEAEMYEITVKDTDGNPIAGVKLKLTAGGKNTLLTTDANGVATSEKKSDAATVSVFQAAGYIVDSSKTYSFTDNKAEIVLEAESSETETYTVYVVDANGNPVAGAEVHICETKDGGVCSAGQKTDADGKAVFTVKAGSWHAKFVSGSEYSEFDANKEVTLVQE